MVSEAHRPRMAELNRDLSLKGEPFILLLWPLD